MQHDVMVSAVHPVLGRLYWVYESGSDCNAPDYYGITNCRTSAMLLPHYWRKNDYLWWRHRSHIYSVFGSDDHASDYTVTEGDSGELHQEMSGLLGSLQARSGQTVEEFRLWLFRAVWSDTPKLELVRVSPAVTLLRNRRNGSHGCQ